MSKASGIFGCKECGKVVKPVDGRLICCGHDEPLPEQRVYGNKDNYGRLHGAQPAFGTGEVHYQHGTLSYLDDGNGNVFEQGEDWEDEH